MSCRELSPRTINKFWELDQVGKVQKQHLMFKQTFSDPIELKFGIYDYWGT